MARKSKKSKVSKLFGTTKSKTSSKSSLLSKASSLISGKTTTTKRRKKSVTQLANELARIKLKRKIQKEKLKGIM